MKRTFPLLITAIGGFVLIVAFFIPFAEGWGEVAAIWFDILAAIAFILGGGNLMKIHLKKISDRQKGWGYSAVTLIAFLVMLCFGLFKIGSNPVANQEYYGEVFAPLQLSEFPESQIATIDGELPEKGTGKGIPPSARRQLTAADGKLRFTGWMRANQKSDLIKYEDELKWQCNIEKLFKQAQPPTALKGKIAYYADHKVLAFKGRMSDEDKQALLDIPKEDNPAWKNAVDKLHEQSNVRHAIPLDELPDGVSIPEGLKDIVTFDADKKELAIVGPMTTAQRDQLAKQFPLARPLKGERRDEFRRQIEQRGDELTEEQRKVFHKYLDGSWDAALLVKTLNDAGKVLETDKTACEMYQEFQDGVKVIEPKKKEGVDATLTDEHVKVIQSFVDDRDMTVKTLIERLKAVDDRRIEQSFLQDGPAQFFTGMFELQPGSFAARQEAALRSFVSRNPTVGERNSRLAVALLRVGTLTDDQREFLTTDYRQQEQWRKKVGELFIASQTVKYPWSGEYRETGTPFWWMYEYAFKPLTATMFAMLAFYVASAAFRAFRAKNVEAALLLGTAFIILLGRTFAGVLLTSWMPESLSGLRIENLTVTIMSVFNTAGTRAIMIGIALGIASTSLKVLLGVDRSYLGSQED